jgi:hypothetical protein
MRARVLERRAARQATPPIEVGRTLVDLFFARVARRIKAWRIVPRELTVAGGELTPTVKRGMVTERSSDLVEELYAR